MQTVRARKSLEKLEIRIAEVVSLGFAEKYPRIFELAQTYASDSRYYFEQGDIFSSFGCSDYAYGLLDALLILENKKEEYPE